jgi:2-iminobutanoate/2-iminopropanoate deaminase
MKQIINTENAPAPIGPYNQAVKFSRLLYTSGQIPVDPRTGKIVTGGIREQAIQVLENLKAVLESAGSSLKDVLKTTVFLADMDDFPEFNVIYAEYFDEISAPARSTIQVAALPLGALVEIELIAGGV